MIAVSLFFALAGLLVGADARSLPTRTLAIRKAAIAEAPAAGPTTPLVSDFKKGNVSATWAEGHPKIWGQELKKFEIGLPPTSYSNGFDGTVTEDGKFVIMVNSTVTQIVNPDTGAVVSTISKPETLNYRNPKIAVVSTPGGGYSVFESYDNDGMRITEQRLTQDGAATGEVIVRPGKFSYFDGPQFSSDNRRMLAINGQVAHVFDLSDPDSIISLAGHVEGVMSAQFSPDGKYIATTSWDQYTRVWESNGKQVKKLGPSGGQNWFTSFSPDSKTLLYSVGGGSGNAGLHIDRVPVSDLTAAPAKTAIRNWSRSIAWSPDGQYIAFSTASGQVTVIKASDGSVAQQWQSTQNQNEPNEVTWLDGGKKLAFHFKGSLEMYDFETNLKYKWGPDELDQYNAYMQGVFHLKSKGLLVTTDADQKVRFWPFPA